MSRFVLPLLVLALLVVGWLGTNPEVFFFYPGAMVLGVAGVVAGLVAFFPRLRPVRNPSAIGALLVLIATAYLFARAWLSPVTYSARDDLLLIAGAFSAYGLGALCFSTGRSLKILLGVLLVVFLGHLLFTIFQFTGLKEFHPLPGFTRSHSLDRASGLFNVANHYAVWLELVLFVFLAVALFGRVGAVFQVVLAVAFFFGIFLLIGTKSRAGVGALVVGSGIFVVLSWLHLRARGNARAKKLFGVALLAALLVGAAGSGFVWKQLASRVEGQGVIEAVSNETYRPTLRELSYDQWRGAPVFGEGARQFQTYFREHRSPIFPVHSPIAFFTHNEYLQLLGEYGGVGLALLLPVLLFHLFRGIRRATRGRLQDAHVQEAASGAIHSAVALGIVAGVGAALAHAVFDLGFHVPAGLLFAALLVGILAAEPGEPSIDIRDRAAFSWSGGLLQIALVAVGVFLVISGRFFRSESLFFETKRQVRHMKELPEETLEKQGRLLEQVLEIDPANHEALHYASFVVKQEALALQGAERRERIEDAMRLSKRCQKLAPDYVFNLLLLGQLHDDLGEKKEADEMFLEAEKKSARNAAVQLEVARHHHRWREWDLARRHYLLSGGGLFYVSGAGDTRFREGLRKLDADQGRARKTLRLRKAPQQP